MKYSYTNFKWTMIGMIIGVLIVMIPAYCLIKPFEKPANTHLEWIENTDQFQADSCFSIVFPDTVIFYPGKTINGFKIYNRVLSKEEIYQLTQAHANKRIYKNMKIGTILISEDGVTITRYKEGWLTIGHGESDFMTNEQFKKWEAQ